MFTSDLEMRWEKLEIRLMKCKFFDCAYMKFSVWYKKNNFQFSSIYFFGTRNSKMRLKIDRSTKKLRPGEKILFGYTIFHVIFHFLWVYFNIFIHAHLQVQFTSLCFVYKVPCALGFFNQNEMKSFLEKQQKKHRID